jgi:glutathione S-transferase
MSQEDGLVLFESGAIVLDIGARSEELLPADEAGKARGRSSNANSLWWRALAAAIQYCTRSDFASHSR